MRRGSTPSLAQDEMRPVVILAMCCVVASCDYRGGPATGTVLEVENFRAPLGEWTLKPIQGAEILVYWEGFRPSGPDSGRTYCLAIAHATSDAQGAYLVPGLKVPRAVSGIEDIVTVSLAYVPDFVEVRPHEYAHLIFAQTSRGGPSVHVLRKAEPPEKADVRENVFHGAKFCPSEEFLAAHKNAPKR